MLELPISRTNCHGPKDVRATEVRLYFLTEVWCSEYYVCGKAQWNTVIVWQCDVSFSWYIGTIIKANDWEKKIRIALSVYILWPWCHLNHYFIGVRFSTAENLALAYAEQNRPNRNISDVINEALPGDTCSLVPLKYFLIFPCSRKSKS